MPDLRPQAKVSLLIGIFAFTAMLYLGQAFLMPLALAILFAFLLAPCVARLERLRLGHTPSVIVTALVAFLILGASIYIVAGQLVDLASSLPKYKDNLRAKAASFRIGGDSPLTKISDAAREVSAEFSKENAASTETGAKPNQPAPVPVEVVDSSTPVLSLLQSVSGSVFGALGTAALVVIMVIFMLIERRDLRDRFIHLVGRGQLRVTTQAIDEAADRVSRYLLAQLIVNVSYGIPIGLGLYFIGIPNAVLWGILATLLRFIPYIGPWIAAIPPVLLSFAIAPGWWPPAATLGLFVVLELTSNNVVEPWLYGSSTGLSPTSIIVAAAFWTWLWGAGGLLLATPLTVILAVLGKYVPTLSFLDVLLGDRPPIAPEQRFYQRLLAGDETDLFEIVEQYAKSGKPGELYDDLIVPALRRSEQDYSTGVITREERAELYTRVRDALNSIEGFADGSAQEDGTVIIVPARSEGDHLAATMLADLLFRSGVSTTVVSHQMLNSEVATRLLGDTHRSLCISALTQTAARSGAVLARKLIGAEPRVAILGAWGQPIDLPAPNIETVPTLREAARTLRDRGPMTPPGPALVAAEAGKA